MRRGKGKSLLSAFRCEFRVRVALLLCSSWVRPCTGGGFQHLISASWPLPHLLQIWDLALLSSLDFNFLGQTEVPVPPSWHREDRYAVGAHRTGEAQTPG